MEMACCACISQQIMGADWDEGVTLASIFGLESSNGELFYKTALGKVEAFWAAYM